MASSGTITSAIRTGYQIRITWTVTGQSIADNTSTVTANVQLVSTGSSYTINSSATKNGSLTVNGTKYTFTFNASLTGSQTKTIFTKTGIVVSHNAEGNKTCSFSCSAGINVTLGGTYYGTVNASGTGTFNTIARASTISSVTESVAVNGTNTCTVAISRKASSFTHTVVWKVGTYSKTTEAVGTSASYAIPLSWLNAIPNDTSGTGTVQVTTYNGSTKIGSTVSKSFKITVPSTVTPSFSSVGVADTMTAVYSKFSSMVQNKSKPKLTITAVGAYGSTIKAYKTVFEGKTYTGATPTTATITKSGTASATITITDSRGRTATTTKTWAVIAYASPKITTFNGTRCLSNGLESYEGTFLKSVVNLSVSPVNDKNTATYLIEYKLQSDSTWTTLTSGSGFSVNTSLISANGFLDANNSYNIRLSITDYFGTVRKVVEIPTAFTLLDFNASGHGISFGKVSEDDGMEIDMDLSVYKSIYMGGNKKADDEKNMYFQTTTGAKNIHNCKLYGGNGDSVTSIGCWDSDHSIGIWRYLASTKNMVIDANVNLTHGNGGNEFVTSGNVTHGTRTGSVRFSNGLLLQWGNVTITPVANTPTVKAVVFGTSYTDAPAVFTTAYSTVPGTTVTASSSANITTTGFDAYVVRINTTNTSVMWFAIGYKA